MIIHAVDHDKIKVPLFDWLHEVYLMLEDGTIETLTPAAYYERRDLLTDEIVDAVCETFDDQLAGELVKAPAWHYNAQGCPNDVELTPTGFADMNLLQRRALVERIDEILQPYRQEPPPPPVTPDPDQAYGVI